METNEHFDKMSDLAEQIISLKEKARHEALAFIDGVIDKIPDGMVVLKQYDEKGHADEDCDITYATYEDDENADLYAEVDDIRCNADDDILVDFSDYGAVKIDTLSTEDIINIAYNVFNVL